MRRFALLPLCALWACPSAPLPERPAESALSAPVEVVRDVDGIAHVYAATESDLWYAQGWVTAHDRLFQMDLLRRRALGRRAEVLGAEYLDSDIQSRGLRFADHAVTRDAALAADDPALHDILVRYAQGVNAYITAARAGTDGASLAPQFGALGYAPEPWTTQHTLAIEELLTAGLSMRPDQDVILGLLRTLMGPELFSDLFLYAPFDAEYVVPDFYEPARDDGGPVLAAGELAQMLAAVPPGDLSAALLAARAWSTGEGGSNNQAVAGALTATGGALVAGDSHQGVRHPATYYLLHLNTAEAGGRVDVWGANFPGVPLVLFGTNGAIGFTPTTSLLDVSDSYLEQWSDATRTAVMWNGQAVPVEVREERILVRPEGGAVEEGTPTFVTMHDVPHHGPILPAEALNLPLPLTVSIRWTGHQNRTGAAAFLGFGVAGDVDEAMTAMQDYYTGGMHWVFGDTTGRIAYSCATDLPVREQVDPADPPSGLLPGTGGFEWLPPDAASAPAPFQRLSYSQVPQVVDPPDGIVNTGNNDPAGVTDDNTPFDAEPFLGGVFDIGTRARRPRQLLQELATQGPLTLDSMQEMQTDTYSRVAFKLLPYLQDAAQSRPDLVTPRMGEALSALDGWDLRCGVQSVPATLFHAWLILAVREVLADEGSGLASLNDLIFVDMDYKFGLITTKFLEHWLRTTAPILDGIDSGAVPFPSASGINFFDRRGTEAVETRDEILLDALRLALEELEQVYADKVTDPTDMDTWQCGLLHTIVLRDAAGEALPEASSPRLPKPGGFFTTDVGDADWLVDGRLPEFLDVTNAPSNRFLFSLGPDGVQGRAILPGGQSERPGDPHHLDQLVDYTQGTYRPVRFTRDEVDAGAESRSVLE
jgi:penicillin amidase